MTLVIPQFFGQVVHQLTWAGDPEPMAVTIGVASDDAADTDDVNDIAARFAQAFVDNMLPQMNDVISLVQTEVTFQADAPPALPLIGISTISGTGAGATTVLPQNSAYLAHKRTAFGGRGGRGRWYLPGVGETSVDNLGNVGGAFVSALNTGLAGYVSDTSGAAPNTGLVLLHTSGGAYAAEDPYPILTMTLDPVIATQRRRLRR